MGYFSSLAPLNTLLLILVTQNRPKIPGKTKRILLGGFPYFGAKKLPVCPKINDFPVSPFESKNATRKMARINPKITPIFRTECDGFPPHFLIQMGSQGKLKKVINFGVHR